MTSNPIYAGRPYWLPPTGHGNGLDAAFWSQIAQVPQAMTGPLLSELAARGVPGWASPVHPFGRQHPDDPEAPYDLWIATSCFDSAEDVVMRYLNAVSEAARPEIDARPPRRELTSRSTPPRHARSGRRTRRHPS